MTPKVARSQGSGLIVQLLLVIDANATNFVYCSVFSAMMLSIVLCLPDVFPNLVRLAFLTQLIHLSDGFYLDLFPFDCY